MAAARLAAAAALALGGLLMAPGLTPPRGKGPWEESGEAAAQRRSPARMDQALLLVRNELPAEGLRLAALSSSCHRVSGGSRGVEGGRAGACHPASRRL